MSRREAVGVPLGAAAAVVVAAVVTSLLRGGTDAGPARLPLSLAGGGGAVGTAETTADARMAAPGYVGAVDYRFTGPTPTDLPSSADVLTLAGGAPSRDAVRRLADALGLAGEITPEKDALVVRDGELVLRVSTTPSRMWTYYREVPPMPGCSEPVADPGMSEEQRKELDARCAGGAPPAEGDGAAGICLEGADSPCNDTPETAPEDSATTDGSAGSGSSGSSSGGSSSASSGATGSGATDADQAVMSCPPPPAECPPDSKCALASCMEPPTQLPLPSEDAALAAARKVFAATGLNDASTVRAERGFDAWYISTNVRVGGLEVIGLAQSVSVGSDGAVRDASGTLAVAELLDRYPLVDAEAGLTRLEKQYSSVRPLIACDPAAAECAAEPAPQTEVLDVTDVRLGLLFSPVWADDRETAYLAPAWVFDVKGRDYPEAVIAIADDYLAQVQPQDRPGDTKIEPGRPEPAQVVDPAHPEPAGS